MLWPFAASAFKWLWRYAEPSSESHSLIFCGFDDKFSPSVVPNDFAFNVFLKLESKMYMPANIFHSWKYNVFLKREFMRRFNSEFFDNGSRVSGLWGFSWLGRDPKKHLPTVSLCISAMFLDEVDDQLIFLSSIQNTLHSLQIVCPRFCPGCNIPLDLQTFKAMKHNQVQQYFSQLNLCRV